MCIDYTQDTWYHTCIEALWCLLVCTLLAHCAIVGIVQGLWRNQYRLNAGLVFAEVFDGQEPGME